MDTNNKTYSVYMLIFPDGKRYVGMTSAKPVEKRWGANGCRYKSQFVYTGISACGWNKVIHEVICRDISFQEAEKRERELILEYNTTDSSCGYNIAHGGVHGKCILNESTKEKLRQWDYDHPETLERMRWYAKHKSPETIEKIRQKATGVKQSVETRKKRAQKMLGKKHSAETIEKIRRTQSNRTWEEKRIEALLSVTEKMVSQYDICGNYICSYDSATKAANAIGGNFGSVSRCCRGERRTYKGYVWRYELSERQCTNE